MAEQNHLRDDALEPSQGNSGDAEGQRCLEDFISEQYEIQKNDGSSDEIDDERAAQFLSRALAESQRMNAEVEKSHAKLDALHSQLSADRLAAWRDEHAAQALPPAQRNALGNDSIYSRSPPTHSA